MGKRHKSTKNGVSLSVGDRLANITNITNINI